MHHTSKIRSRGTRALLVLLLAWLFGHLGVDAMVDCPSPAECAGLASEHEHEPHHCVQDDHGSHMLAVQPAQHIAFDPGALLPEPPATRLVGGASPRGTHSIDGPLCRPLLSDPWSQRVGLRLYA